MSDLKYMLERLYERGHELALSPVEIQDIILAHLVMSKARECHRYDVYLENRDVEKYDNIVTGEDSYSILLFLKSTNIQLLGRWCEITYNNIYTLKKKFEFSSSFELFEKDVYRLCDSTRHLDIFDRTIRAYTDRTLVVGSDFYSPLEIGRLLSKLLIKKNINISVLDPACGSGGFLRSILEEAHDDNGAKVDVKLHGQDKVLSTAQLAAINMFLSNVKNSKIYSSDSLLDPQTSIDSYDVVVSNPPFSVSIDDSRLLKAERLPFGFPPKSKADYAFIQYAYSSLKPQGCAGLVVSTGVLFRSGSEESIRRNMVDDGTISTVIELPKKLFSGVSISVAILLLEKGRRDKSTLFIDASKLFNKLPSYNVLSSEGICEIVECVKKKQVINGFSYIADLDEIKTNNYNLNVSRYVKNEVKESVNTISELISTRDQLQNKLQILQKEADNIARDIL